MKPFKSFMAPQLEQYLVYRKHLGYAQRGATSALLAFDEYLIRQNADWQSLQPMFFLELREKIDKKPRTVNTTLSVLRTFFKYLIRCGLCQQNPIDDVPPMPETYFVPFVFSPEQIELLLSAACRKIRKSEKHFLTDLAKYVAIVLLARCGMRIKEPLRALRKHYRSDEATLYIKKTKFRKDRLIPLPGNAWTAVENYLAVRAALCAGDDDNPYLLADKNQKGLSHEQVRRAFHDAVKNIELCSPKEVVGDMTFGAPIPHSLRHSFAVNTLKRIKDQGKSPQHALPVLAAYMGHRKYHYTAAYLKVLDAKHRTGLMDFAKSQLDAV
jgi:integrase/recombinase XerD